MICANEIWRERSCSVSLGGLTSQDRKDRSSMSGAHSAAFHDISFEIAAHGCLKTRQNQSCTALGSLDHAPAEKYDDGVALRGDEAKHEHVLAATVVALGCRFSKRGLRMQDDFLVLSAHEMVDDVRGRRVPARVAKPLLADEALDDRCRGVDATIAREWSE